MDTPNIAVKLFQLFQLFLHAVFKVVVSDEGKQPHISSRDIRRRTADI